MVDLTELHRFVSQSPPLSEEVSVLEIDPTCSNQVITEQVIVIHDVDLDLGAAWEYNWEVKVLAKLRFWVI